MQESHRSSGCHFRQSQSQPLAVPQPHQYIHPMLACINSNKLFVDLNFFSVSALWGCEFQAPPGIQCIGMRYLLVLLVTWQTNLTRFVTSQCAHNRMAG